MYVQAPGKDAFGAARGRQHDEESGCGSLEIVGIFFYILHTWTETSAPARLARGMSLCYFYAILLLSHIPAGMPAVMIFPLSGHDS
ncbi:hypothetical protein LY76DRAFT_123422 [Colletotrichum caudatum]|nr:hypothetical protein LY76DRAFT_123422 [Colletotrichum caudatum]